MKHKRSDRRRRAGIIIFILAVAFAVSGTLAWQSIRQRAVNNAKGKPLQAGARLHDDFGLADEPDFTQPLNKDVYVENYSGQNLQNTNDSGETVFVRVKLMEYMEMGVGAGLFSVSGDDPSDYQTLDQVDAGGTRIEDSANDAVSLVSGASILNLSTWRTHVEGDLTNPFAAYWNWKMGGTKAFMPTYNKDSNSLLTDRTDYAHDKYTVGDTENSTAHYANPTYDNNPEEHTAKDTLATAGVVSMEEWMEDLNHPTAEADTGKGYWVGDTDGWYYWSKGLEAGEATALLLDQITLTGAVEGEFYYGIHVISEMATAGDWGDADDETGFYDEGLTADGKFLLDQAADSSAKGEKILYAPMDDIGTSIPDTMLLYAPMDGVGYPNENTPLPTAAFTDSANGKTFSVLGGNITHTTTQKIVGNQSAYFSGATNQRINATIPELNLGTSDFTVSFWVNPEGQTVGWPELFGHEDNANFRFFLADNNTWAKGYPCLYLSGNNIRIVGTKKYTPNVWTHYAVVREDGVFTLYENGISIGTNASATTLAVDFSNLSIGGNSATSLTTYKGYMDDFAIYDSAKWSDDFTPPTEAQTDANLVYLDLEETPPPVPPMSQEPIKEVISNTYFDILGNAFLEGKEDIYKFGGSSLYFPGTALQRINTQNSNLNFGTKDFTVSFWAYPETTQPQKWSFAFGNDVNAKFDFAMQWDNGPIGLNVNANNLSCINTNRDFIPNVWTHYSLVREDGVFTIYENGKSIGSSSSFTTVNVDLSNFSIGGNNSSVTAYKGYMDDFAIYSYAKYDGDFTPPTVTADVDPANMDTDELEIKDEVTGNNFTVLGSANIVGTDKQKKFGNALYFPGTISQRINLQNEDLNFGTKDFTVSFWAYPETPQPQPWPLLFGHDTNGTFDFFLSWNHGPISLRGNSLAAGQPNYINTNKNFTPNVWTHFAVVRKGGVFTVYENGINIGSTSSFAAEEVNLSHLSICGNDSNVTAYKGYIDDFSIYDYAVWHSDFTPPTSAGKP